ncbi:MAG TPA: Ni/Fe hydrogenase subunit alpha [Anaeromyxobacteraceae bacterium]|nr:Ni/Fe hydrogenase subunit alpha [Anaeromyxobacteraceae bacterium]
MRTITIDPVTRIEGHARVLLDVEDDGNVKSARLVVNELRGFERMLVGMEADRMPLVTARICGVCPVSHAIAAVKALEGLWGVEPPPAAILAREILAAGHLIHSHALHLFALAGPDLYFGLAGDTTKRNVLGLAEVEPELARKALRLRTLGQKLVEGLGGRGVHPVTIVAGGISFQPTTEELAAMEGAADEMVALARELAAWGRGLLLTLAEREPALLGAEVRSHDLCLVKDDKVSHYDGALRLCGPDGATVAEIPCGAYAEHMEERVFEWSYMKPVLFKQGGSEVSYRVGPLARLNVAKSMGTPHADAELAAFRQAFPRPCHLTVMHHWARIVELVWACETARANLAEPTLRGPMRVPVKVRAGHGVGCVEAPRGTLIHEYVVDGKGIVRLANLLIATQQNYAAINQSLEQAARSHVAGKGDQAVLNAVEFAIRCYDPCLSCATHAVGQMPIAVEIRRGGEVVRTIVRKR